MLFVVRNGDSSASVGVALRIHARRVSSSVKRAQRAHTWLRDAAMTREVVSAAHFWQRGHSSWRARFPRLRCFGSSVAALFFSGSHAPNNSFKPTPYRGFVDTCDRERNTGPPLPRSARLNSGVRRLKAFVLFASRTGAFIGFGGNAFGQLSARSSSVAGQGALMHGQRFLHGTECVLRKRVVPAPFGTAPVRARGALGFFGFGVSAAVPRRCSSRAPPRLTIRSSRRRFLASLKLTIVRAILAPHCRGRRGLTQALEGTWKGTFLPR